MPGASLLQRHAETLPSSSALNSGLLRSSQATEEVVMELLGICLERIGWQGNVSDWRDRLKQALDRVQSRLSSETDRLMLLVTGFQMDCLANLCHAATVGDEAETLLQALLLCDAVLPFHHWCENRPLSESDKQDLLAQHHPEIHTLLHAALRRV